MGFEQSSAKLFYSSTFLTTWEGGGGDEAYLNCNVYENMDTFI